MENKKLIVLGALVAVNILVFFNAFSPTSKKISKVATKTVLQPQEKGEASAPVTLESKSSSSTAHELWGRDPFVRKLAPAQSEKESLEGIIWDEETPMAMINDSVVKVGDNVNGNTVIEIKQDCVILNDGRKNFELKLGERQ